MSGEFSFHRHSEPREVELESVGKSGFTTFFAVGIVNPMGPTLNALAADGIGAVNERLALLHLMLNPFSQTCYEVGFLTLGETWSPVRDLRPFFSLPLGSCPTLLMPSALYSDECAKDLFSELLQSFEDGNEAWDKLRHFPGDPWKRVEKEMAGLPDLIASSLKKMQTGEQPRRLRATEALEFAQLQLQPKNLGEEFKAFVFAWEGSINFTGLGSMAMSKDRFVETFGRLAMTLRLPFMPNIIDNPEVVAEKLTKKDRLRKLFGRRSGEASTRPGISRRVEAQEHPLLQVAELKYSESSMEHTLVLRFLNERVITEQISGNEDSSALIQRLAILTRDARRWAEQLLDNDPQSCNAMFEEDTEASIQNVRALLKKELGPDPARINDQHASEALINWAEDAGFQLSDNPAQLWGFVLEVVDAALWLGWLFPRIPH